jgi:hypothetical protein
LEIPGEESSLTSQVISALEHYKSGKGKAAAFFKYRGLLDTLILRLRTQRTLFYLNTMILLKAAGVDDLTGQHEEDCIKLLQDDETGVVIKTYLDFTYDTFESIVHEYERCLKSIVAKLTNINRLPKVRLESVSSPWLESVC